MAEVTILYIGGYGRSGSTLLETLLCDHPAVWGLGEAGRPSVETLDHDRLCTCGETAKACRVWRFLCEAGRDTCEWTHLDMIEKAADVMPPEARVAIDGSKTAWSRIFFPFIAKWRFGDRFLMFHIVRHPCGVVWSTLKGSNRALEKRGDDKRGALFRPFRVVWTIMGWLAANLSASLFGLLFRNAYRRVAYEQMTADPKGVIGDLWQRLDLDAPENVGGQAADNRHQLFGNRMRMNTTFEVRPDEDWKDKLTWYYRLSCTVMTAPLRFLLRI